MAGRSSPERPRRASAWRGVHRRAESRGRPGGAGPRPNAWAPSAARDQLAAMTARRCSSGSSWSRTGPEGVHVANDRVGGLSLDRVRILHRGTEVGRMFVVELELDPIAVNSGLTLPLAAALSAVDGLPPTRRASWNERSGCCRRAEAGQSPSGRRRMRASVGRGLGSGATSVARSRTSPAGPRDGGRSAAAPRGRRFPGPPAPRPRGAVADVGAPHRDAIARGQDRLEPATADRERAGDHWLAAAPQEIAGDVGRASGRGRSPRGRFAAARDRVVRRRRGPAACRRARRHPRSAAPASPSAREGGERIGHAGNLESQAAVLTEGDRAGAGPPAARRGSPGIVEGGVDHGGLHRRDAGGQASSGRVAAGGTGSEAAQPSRERLGALRWRGRASSVSAALADFAGALLAFAAALTGLAAAFGPPSPSASRPFAAPLRARHARLEGGHQVTDARRLRLLDRRRRLARDLRLDDGHEGLAVVVVILLGVEDTDIDATSCSAILRSAGLTSISSSGMSSSSSERTSSGQWRVVSSIVLV